MNWIEEHMSKATIKNLKEENEKLKVRVAELEAELKRTKVNKGVSK